MTKYSWLKEKGPEDLDIKQVYGVVFSDDGQILLRVEDDKYKLTGGKPERYDSNFEETLKREYLEELNIEIENSHYLGYLLVEDETKEYAQVRMIARVKSVGDIRPDPDNGKIYQRFMSSVKNVKSYLNYPDLAGNQLIEDAIHLAKETYQINFSDDEYFI